MCYAKPEETLHCPASKPAAYVYVCVSALVILEICLRSLFIIRHITATTSPPQLTCPHAANETPPGTLQVWNASATIIHRRYQLARLNGKNKCKQTNEVELKNENYTKMALFNCRSIANKAGLSMILLLQMNLTWCS
jgi:hypothetical protein